MAFKQSPPLFQVPGLSDAARQLITRLFFRSLIIYLLLDGLIFLLFGGGQWRWWLLFAAEAAVWDALPAAWAAPASRRGPASSAGT